MKEPRMNNHNPIMKPGTHDFPKCHTITDFEECLISHGTYGKNDQRDVKCHWINNISKDHWQKNSAEPKTGACVKNPEVLDRRHLGNKGIEDAVCTGFTNFNCEDSISNYIPNSTFSNEFDWEKNDDGIWEKNYETQPMGTKDLVHSSNSNEDVCPEKSFMKVCSKWTHKLENFDTSKGCCGVSDLPEQYSIGSQVWSNKLKP